MFILKLLETMFTWKNMIAQIIICQMLAIAIVLVAHTSSLNFKFTDHTLEKLIIFTTNFHFQALAMSLADIDDTTRDKIRDNLRHNTKVTIMKFIGKFCLRFIVTFVLVYVLATFADNLLLVVLGLSDTNVFIIYGVWCTIVVMYPLALSFSFVVLQYAWTKERDIDPVEVTMLLKVSIGYLVNSMLMSPLIMKVGDELKPKWGVIMRGIVCVGFVTPILVLCMLHIVLGMKDLINSLKSHHEETMDA